jgi:hypothetical protein
MPEISTKENWNLKSIALKLEKGALRIADIKKLIPITSLATEMNINYNTLCKRLLDPRTFTTEDVFNLAKLLQMDPTILFDVIIREMGPTNRSQDKISPFELNSKRTVVA